MLSQEELALLEAIRESGSLSRAAARLGKAPSTVSIPPVSSKSASMRCCSTVAATECSSPAGQLLAQEAARLMQDVAWLTQRVKQVAGG